MAVNMSLPAGGTAKLILGNGTITVREYVQEPLIPSRYHQLRSLALLYMELERKRLSEDV